MVYLVGSGAFIPSPLLHPLPSPASPLGDDRLHQEMLRAAGQGVGEGITVAEDHPGGSRSDPSGSASSVETEELLRRNIALVGSGGGFEEEEDY